MSLPVTEKELVAGCIRGERASHEMLYKAFSRKMFGICLGYAKNYARAKDILQDGFIKVFNNICSFQGNGSLEGWIRRIIVNTAIDDYRRNSRHPLVCIDVHDEDIELGDHSVLERINEKELMALIHELPDGYRMVLNFYAVEGYSHKEIAKMLGISEGTSKSQLFYAKRALKAKIIRRYGVEYLEKIYVQPVLQLVQADV